MEFFALDISKRRIGIAIGHFYETNYIVLPWKIIEPHEFHTTIGQIKKNRNKVIFIIGMPGRKYENFIRVKHFTHKYRNILKPFYFQDENFTTMLVQNATNKKTLNDDLAACAILELFFKGKTYGDVCKL